MRSITQEATPQKHHLVPFLRWAGGKQQIIKQLLDFLPEDVSGRSYFEPFLGGGALFFALQPENAFLSDLNAHLIETYKHVRSSPELVSRYLRNHATKTSEDYYYRIRQEYNQSTFSAAQAARFIYINKTCFNGIFRVNQKGEYNVPYGRKEPPAIPSVNHLREIGAALKSVDIQTHSFDEALKNIRSEDFVYLDPPYPPLNGTAYFTHYTSERFDHLDQSRLASLVRELDKSGIKVMISNADTPLIRKLYRGFNKYKLSVTRYITCKSKRFRVTELVITNYKCHYH